MLGMGFIVYKCKFHCGLVLGAQPKYSNIVPDRKVVKLRSFINQIMDIRQANYEDPYIDLWSSINQYVVLQ